MKDTMQKKTFPGLAVAASWNTLNPPKASITEAVMKKKLKPGDTIPGCNSFFLCKYLKDTMLQARTYLFCAIRPEVLQH
jgi:hypothetical protein